MNDAKLLETIPEEASKLECIEQNPIDGKRSVAEKFNLWTCNVHPTLHIIFQYTEAGYYARPLKPLPKAPFNMKRKILIINVLFI